MGEAPSSKSQAPKKLQRANLQKAPRANLKMAGQQGDGRDGKPYDLEERTFLFAERVRAFVRRLPRTICNLEDCKQLVRASGSIGANYIEANECLGKKDFQLHVKISRKESKESRYWARLVDTRNNVDLERERETLIQECSEFIRIFSAMLRPRG